MTRTLKFLAVAAALMLIVPATALAKKSKEEKAAEEAAKAAEEHENHMQEIDPLEEGDLKVTLDDVHCQMAFALVRANFVNEGNDYIIVHKEAPVFHIAGLKLQPFDGKEKKPIIIDPHSKASHTYKVKGEDLHVEDFEMDFEGVDLATSEGKIHKAIDFDLEADNKFKAGPFECNMTGLKKETKETQAGFECTYKGDAIGFVDSSALKMTITPEVQKEDRTPKTYANGDRKAEKKMVQPGAKVKFKAYFTVEPRFADMQFAQMVVMWGDTFTESEIQKIDLGTIEFELDERRTAEKND
jgi:hypothetical protein